MYLLYRGTVLELRNLHLLLIRIKLNLTNRVGIKRKICIVLQWGACSSKTPAFCYWHQTLWPPFSLSIEGLWDVFLQRLHCFFVFSGQNHSILKDCHPIKDTWIFHLGMFVLHFLFYFFFSLSPRVSELLEWTRVNVMILYCRDYHSTALSQKIYN